MADIPLTAEKFLSLIWDGAPDGWWVTLATFPTGLYTPEEGPTKQLWYQMPQERERLLVTIKSNTASDLYVCPSVFARKRETDHLGRTLPGTGRTKNNEVWTRCVHQDADSCQPEQFNVDPTIHVQSSPGRWQLYWMLDTPRTGADVDEVADVGRTMAHTHRDLGCDQGGWAVTKLLRVPETANNKRPAPYTVAAHTNGLAYRLEDLRRAYPAPDQERPSPATLEPFPLSLPTADQAIQAVQNDAKLIDLLNTKGRAPTPERPGNRSQLMWLLLKTLAEKRVPRSTALVLGWGVRYNKYRLNQAHPGEFWNEVCKAYARFSPGPDPDESDDGGEEGEEAEEEDPEEDRPPIILVNGAERQMIPHTIIDNYLAWATTKTDAAKQYHEAAFLTALGCIFGEYGRLNIDFDSGYLNMWFMVLGGTTLNRKSTAMRMMVRLLRHLSDPPYDYVLGSDVTPEGLHDTLLDRDGLSSLLYRDEVQGLRREQHAKSYLAGLEPKMTELYDGTVSGKIRVGTGHKREAETVFSLYLTGITDDVADSYELRDFGSGHLARFLYVHAPTPPLTRERAYIHQRNTEDVFDTRVDRPYEHLLDRLRTARTWWENSVTPRGQQVHVPWAVNAWERYNEANWQAQRWAANHPHHRVLAPTMHRTFLTVAKIATLLAMAEQQTKVDMPHLLRALKFAEDCLKYLMTIIDKVAATGRTRIIEEILGRLDVAAERGMTFNQLYKNFQGIMPVGHFRQFLHDLEGAGDIVMADNRIRRKKDG